MARAAVTAADLHRRIAERSARVGIIGQGYVGLPLAVEFGRVGFAVTGFDTSVNRVTTLNAGRSHTPDVPDEVLRARIEVGRYQATTSLAALYLRAVFARHGYPARTVPNLVDTARFWYRDRMPPRARFLSARNFETYYRVDVTLEAFALVRERFPSATLTIAGDGCERGRLVRRAAALGDRGIRFVGRVNPVDMPAFYEAADVFVNSSIVDNQPLSVLEAFAAGLPVVSTAAGDIGAFVRDAETGLVVPPDDPAAMAKALTGVLEYPGRTQRMARQARSEVEAFTWARLRDQWAAAYAGVPT